MINRYINRPVFKNDREEYEETFRERDVKFINQYGTPNFIQPTVEQIENLDLQEHVWKVGDRFYKLADYYYGDPEDWWIIARFNNKPTESHISVGEIIYIPLEIQQVIQVMKG